MFCFFFCIYLADDLFLSSKGLFIGEYCSSCFTISGMIYFTNLVHFFLVMEKSLFETILLHLRDNSGVKNSAVILLKDKNIQCIITD